MTPTRVRDPRGPEHVHDRLEERALGRLRESKGTQSAIVMVVAGLVLARVAIFALELALDLGNNGEALRAVQMVSGVVSTAVDVVVLFVVLLLFDASRRIERESDRIQSFMDHVYRRGL